MYDRLYLEYSALDADSELNNAEFRFRNENGNEISLSDSDDDGVATRTLESWYSEGTYSLYSIRLSDNAQDDNVIYYKASGRTEYYDQTYESNLNGEHLFDFDNVSFTYTKSAEIQN